MKTHTIRSTSIASVRKRALLVFPLVIIVFWTVTATTVYAGWKSGELQSVAGTVIATGKQLQKSMAVSIMGEISPETDSSIHVPPIASPSATPTKQPIIYRKLPTATPQQIRATTQGMTQQEIDAWWQKAQQENAQKTQASQQQLQQFQQQSQSNLQLFQQQAQQGMTDFDAQAKAQMDAFKQAHGL